MMGGIFAGRGLVGVALAFGLAACVGTETADGLFYVPPKAVGAATVSTGKPVAEVAQILRDAGLGEVQVSGGVVTLRSRDPRLVDCGTFVQVAMGNRAEFPATAADSVLMEGFSTPGLVRRQVETQSIIRLTLQSDGAGYDLSETHTVSRMYRKLESKARSTTQVSFDGLTEGVFPNKTSCRSSGLVAGLLR